MTTWVEDAASGRSYRPRAVVAAWAAVVTSPGAFFEERVTPGDQGPALVFAMGVTLVAATTHLALVPDARPNVGSGPLAGSVLAVALLVLLATPAALHLVAAVATLVLRALAPDRGGVSETVQVLAYATAPCALAGLPVPAVTVAVCLYGTVLLAVGFTVRHDLPVERATVAALVPATLVFGYAYGGFAALGL